MRPYLAVLKDSFREAFASRVLWLTLVLIAVFLLAIAPLSLTTGLATELQPEEITDGIGLLTQITDDAGKPAPSPGRHLWSLLSESDRERLQDVLEDNDDSRRGSGRLRRELDELLTIADFYDETSWASVELDNDLQALVSRGDLSDAERAARNRRLLAAAFPDSIDLESDEALYPSYFTWQLDTPIPGSTKLKTEIVNQVVVATCQLLLGFFGIFISILVTASLVPHTFEAGEISLLLSKPVSRPLLFLTRFLGGCVFTLLNVAFLLGGLWLVVGLRFDVWNHRLLLCIPLYLFLFMIYYAVSATAGALWRNSILAICLTLLFWFGLFLIAAAVGSIDQFLIAPNRITEIVPTDGTPLIVNQSSELRQWSESTADGGRGWEEIFRDTSNDSPRIARRFMYSGSRFRPAFDPADDRIVAVEPLPGAFGTIGSSRLVVGYQENDWQRESAGQAPAPIHSVFIDPKGRTILVGLGHVYEYTGEPVKLTEAQQWIADKLSGFLKMGNRDAFRELRPDLPAWKLPFDAAMDAATGRLAVYSDGNVTVLEQAEDGTYQVSTERELPTEDREPALIAIAGDRVLVAGESGALSLFDRSTLEETANDRLFDDQPPRQVAASSDGRYFAALSHDHRLWLFDAESDRDLSASLPGQEDIQAVAFDHENRLFLADRTSRVREFDPGTLEVVAEFAPSLDWLELTYRYLLRPLYTVLPKPGELNNLVNYLLTGEDEVVLADESAPANLQQERFTLDLWTPFWSNLAFLVVILTFTSWRISRRDF